MYYENLLYHRRCDVVCVHLCVAFRRLLILVQIL